MKETSGTFKSDLMTQSDYLTSFDEYLKTKQQIKIYTKTQSADYVVKKYTHPPKFVNLSVISS